MAEKGLLPCPFCGGTPWFEGNAADWKDHYVELSVSCCATMTETLGWRTARDMTVEARTVELQNRLIERWNRRKSDAEESDKGPWKVADNGRALYSDDFDHDVTIKISGDFADDEQRIGYAKAIADVLNAANMELAHELMGIAADVDAGNGFDPVCRRTLQRVIDALKEQEAAKMVNAEPVAWRAWDDGLSRWDFTLWPDEQCNEGRDWEPVFTSPRIPEGWVMVPNEPTPEMQSAARMYSQASTSTIYRAMIAAAPKHGEKE